MADAHAVHQAGTAAVAEKRFMRLIRTCLVLLVFLFCFSPVFIYAKTEQGCINTPEIREYVASAKTGALVWLGTGKVGVYEEFVGY